MIDITTNYVINKTKVFLYLLLLAKVSFFGLGLVTLFLCITFLHSTIPLLNVHHLLIQNDQIVVIYVPYDHELGILQFLK